MVKMLAPIQNSEWLLNRIINQSLKQDVLVFIASVLTGSLLFIAVSLSLPDISRWPVNTGPAGSAVMAGTLLGMFVADGLFFLLIISLVEHFFVLFIKDHPAFEKSMKSVIYASAIPLMLIWAMLVFPGLYVIPVLTGVFALMTFFGVREFHSVSNDRALFVSVFILLFILVMMYCANVILFSR